MEERGEDMYLREDIVEFATDISQSSFNVKHFKKLHAAKHKQALRTRPRIFTEQDSSDGQLQKGREGKEGAGLDLNKTLRYNETFIPPKKQGRFFSKPLVKSADRLQVIKSRRTGSERKGEGRGSLLEKYEREWSQGRMKERCIEEWLNSVIVEYCHDDYFDKGVANSALKKLGVDENSLVAKGLAAKNVGRLYRGLFVFGMGFNSLLGELVEGNMQVLKTVWKVYSMVLEYCSKGGLVTVIGEIEREAAAKVSGLTGEIVRRQEIIERNEELNEEKNAEIFREIKQLRAENGNLSNEKAVLVEEYNSTEQAFTEEVGLRLKFETKINEIYGLHRDLGIKHQKLYGDFSSKVEELRTCADKYFESTIRGQEVRESQYRLQEELLVARTVGRREKERVEELLRERIGLLGRAGRAEAGLGEVEREVEALRVRERLWGSQRAGLEAMVAMREKSAKETHREYQITLEENNRLYILLSDQRKLMEEYEREKKNFNSKVISIVSENSYHKRKMEEGQRRADALQEQERELQARLQALTLELDVKARSEESLQSFFSKSEVSLAEMRRLHIAGQEELDFLRHYHRSMEGVLREKNDRLEAASAECGRVREELEGLRAEAAGAHSRYALLVEEKRINEEVFDFKAAKLRLLQEEVREKEEMLEQMKVRFALEEEGLRTRLETMAVSFKNEKFERNTLNSSYTQALKIIEKKNAAERELNVRISLMEGEIEKERVRGRLLQRNIASLTASFSKTEEQLQQTLAQQRQLIASKVDFVHPLRFEDTHAALLREADKNFENRTAIFRLQGELERERRTGRQEVERLHYTYRQEITGLTERSEKSLEKASAELAFEKQQCGALKAKVKQYEELADSYRKKIQERETSEREEQYRASLEEKKRELERMMGEMERLQDQLEAANRGRFGREEEGWEESGRLKALEAIRKQLELEFGMKLRELQRDLREEYGRKEEALKGEQEGVIRGMSMEEILRIKAMKPNEVLKELSLTHKLERFTPNHSAEMSREQREVLLSHEDSKKRRRINKLIKNAYDYYH